MIDFNRPINLSCHWREDEMAKTNFYGSMKAI